MRVSNLDGAPPRGDRLHDYVEAFETAYARNGEADLDDFLPSPDHPLYLAVLRELVHVELDKAWEQGRRASLEEYRERYPQLFGDQSCLASIAFEEYRLRRRAGENPSPAEYHQRYGVPVADWPGPEIKPAGTSAPAKAPGLSSENSDVWSILQRPSLRESVIPESDSASFSDLAKNLELFRALQVADPESASHLSSAWSSMPEVGTEFLGFHLLQELGHGAFGKVYLAQQGQLANRLVALKVAPGILGESQTLAQLQHTNIVPIYSFHQAGPLQAVCMPYLGNTTLADVIHDFSSHKGLPQSGKGLVSTLNDRQKSTKKKTLSRSKAGQTPPDSEPKPTDSDSGVVRAPEIVPANLQILEKMTYVQSVLWLAARLIDGLAHAHERGILHRDLKPANILVTDDGEPMVLDFNLSEDTKLRSSAEAASIGGTLPYMAPEHLGAFRGVAPQVDARSDIYSFGVVLYELLAGRHPFPVYRGLSVEAVIDSMIRDRSQSPPRLRQYNKSVTPAIESIVRVCLAPQPEQRYQTARELEQDLKRHLSHRPLKYAPEPSLAERAQKFRKRHPRLTSTGSMAACALLVIAIMSGFFISRGRSLARLQAQELLGQFRQDAQTVEFYLNARTASEHLNEGIRLCRENLARYSVLDDPNWRNRPALSYLSESDRQQLEQDIGRTLFMFARALTLQAPADAADPKKAKSVEEAARLAQLAESCYDSERIPRVVRELQAEIAARLGKKEQAARLSQQSEDIPLRTAQDYYMAGFRQAEQGHFSEALALLRQASRLSPQDFNVCFLQGICHDNLHQNAEAAASYRTCIALRPAFAWSYFNRGLAYLRLGDYQQARADFDVFIKLEPLKAEAYLNRAQALQGSKDYQAAVSDLTQALELGSPPSFTYSLRARMKESLGDKRGAADDRAEGLKHTPTDEQSWVARGLDRLRSDPDKAVEDFDKALAINPRYLPALQNKAHVLSKWLRRTEDSIQVLDRAIEFYPDDVRPRAGRGVLLARLGRREAALRDAEKALARDLSPSNVYQVAGIYALTSTQVEADRQEAFRLLSAALTKGFGFEYIEDDPDLAPIRNHPRFRELLNATRAIRPTAVMRPGS